MLMRESTGRALRKGLGLGVHGFRRSQNSSIYMSNNDVGKESVINL